MAIGKMREVVVFLANSPTAAAGRGQVDNYSTLLTTRGQLIKKSESRNLSFGTLNDNDFFTLICRFQTAIANTLRSDTKIVIDSVTYTMNGRPKLIDQRKHLYEFNIQSSLK